ncbi:MAG TPA: ABC transporter permease, partial [Thermoanaerobaculia bacterium]|nr:ABC transporter permease [Thermoanaerobaculia bacterium]
MSWGRRLLAAHTALVYLFLWVPIAVLAVFSFNAGRQTAVWRGVTLDWYRRLLADDALLASVRNSLAAAALTTVIATAIGTLAALALRRATAPGRGATLALLFLPMVIPEVVLGAALLTFFGAIGL